MPVTVVVGGQFGSEGKGKVAQYLAARQRAVAAVRIGGSNSGHTGFTQSGAPDVLRQLPTAALLPDVECVLGPGSYVDVDVLLAEIERTELAPERLLIDSKAFVITAADRESELRSGQQEGIGSTNSGTGAAVRRRIDRRGGGPRVTDVKKLRRHVTDTTAHLRAILANEGRVIVEGTQGHGLSVLHSPHFPYTTSRDTSAAGAISEAGLSPLDVDQVCLVLRAFPIRVGGNSGPLPNEIDWETLRAESGSRSELDEYTSVTRRLRRVARFDPAIVRRAIDVNTPSMIVLNHLDHVDASCLDSQELTPRARSFVSWVENEIGYQVSLLGVSPTAFVERSAEAIRAA